MPRWLTATVILLVTLSWIPLALALRARAVKSTEPRIHIIQDMDNQPKVKAQSRFPLFADRRGMRPPVPGTVARGTVLDDPALTIGRVEGAVPAPMADLKGALEGGHALGDVVQLGAVPALTCACPKDVLLDVRARHVAQSVYSVQPPHWLVLGVTPPGRED